MPYIAGSLTDIAEQFEDTAKIARRCSVGAKTRREGCELLAEARTWEAAARMLRDTTIRKTAVELASDLLEKMSG